MAWIGRHWTKAIMMAVGASTPCKARALQIATLQAREKSNCSNKWDTDDLESGVTDWEMRYPT
jgi:hypothetical protein